VLAGLHLAWVREPDLPPGEERLSPREREVLAGLRLAKRRTDWLLGRWAAKRAVSSLFGRLADVAAASGVEVLAAEDGRPEFRPGAGRLSISHAGAVGFAAAAPGTAAVGCDVEVVEARSQAFVTDYFTEREAAAIRRLAAPDAVLAANLIWSAKESALKALGEGLRMDTRRVEVDVEAWMEGQPSGLPSRAGSADWRPLRVSAPRGVRFGGWWRVRDGLVWTVLTPR